MSRDEMIEVMARAIGSTVYKHPGLYVAGGRQYVEACSTLSSELLSFLEAAGYVVVPSDDVTRPFSDSALPPQMIEAGMDALEKARDDMERNYVPGEAIDWDDGMIAVAVYRAMLSAAQQEKTDAG